MSKKIAFFSCILLSFGAIAIPGGPIIGDLITDMTYSMVDDGLLGIQDEAGPMIDQMVLDAFTAILLGAAFDGMEMEFSGFPVTADAVPLRDFFRNPSSNFEVYVKIGIGNLLGAQVDVFKLKGVANYLDNGSLNTNPQVYVNFASKVKEDVDTGSGVSDFLEMYDGCTNDAKKETMARLYANKENSNNFEWEPIWDDLTDIVIYVREYIQGYYIQWLIDGTELSLSFFFAGVSIPTTTELRDALFSIIDIPTKVYIVELLKPELAGLKNPHEIGVFMLWQQWANGTLLPEGFGLPLIGGTFYGFEVGVPNPSNMTEEVVLNLWNEESEVSLVNSVGIDKWISYPEKGSELYNELMIGNNLTEAQMDGIFPWLVNFQHNVMPYLAQHQMSLPVDTITLAGMLEIGMITIGILFIVLGTTGLISNRVVKHNAKKPPKMKPPKPKKMPMTYPQVDTRKKYIEPKTVSKRVWNEQLGFYEYKKLPKASN